MLKNGIYNFLGTGFRIGLGAMSVPILLYFLKLEQYGLYSIIMSIIAFAVLTEWSISLSLTIFLTKGIAENGELKESNINHILIVCFFLIVIFATVASVILWYLAPMIPSMLTGISFQDKVIITNGCRLSIFIVWARLLQQYFIGIEQAYNKYASLNIINTVFNLTQTISVIIIAWLTRRILPIIIVQAIVSSSFVLVHVIVCSRLNVFKKLTFKEYNYFKQTKPIVIFTLRTWTGTIGSVLFNQGDRLLVGSILNVEMVGVYSAITSLAYQINVLSSIPAQPLISIVSKTNYAVNNENDLYSRKQSELSIKKGILLNTIIAVFMGSFFSLFSPEIVKLLFTSTIIKTTQMDYYLVLIVSIYTIYSFNAVGYYILFATNHESINTITTLLCGSITLCLIYFLTKYFGLIGAILGNSAFIMTLYLFYRGIKVVNISWINIVKIIKLPLLLFILSLLVTVFVNSIIFRTLFALSLITILTQFSMRCVKAFSKSV